MGSRKPIEAPPSTQSIVTALSSASSCLPKTLRRRICVALNTAIPWCPHTFGRDDHDITCSLARSIAKCRWLVDLHGQTVIWTQTIRHSPNRHFNSAVLQPDLLVEASIARRGFVRHSCTSGQRNFADSNGRRNAGRRDVTAHVTGLRI